MPVFDFNNTSEQTEMVQSECTYTVFYSDETEATPEKPMLVLDNKARQWKHHSCGIFLNPTKRTAFEFKEEDETIQADILKIDARFISLLPQTLTRPAASWWLKGLPALTPQLLRTACGCIFSW